MSHASIPPIALVVFNRPDLAAGQVRRLQALAPTRLLIIADGPRSRVEAGLCAQTQEVIREGITWSADVSWNVAEANLGLRERILTGLDWVFSQVDEAIILEDDIEVAPEFFDFAVEHLAANRDDPRVGSITGRNLLVAYGGPGATLHGRRSSVWGWATWADRWREFRTTFEPMDLDALAGLPEAMTDLHARILRHLHRRQALGKAEQEWSLEWSLWHAATDRRSIAPTRNLVVNHGFRADATHTAAEGDLRGEFPILRQVDRPARSIDLDYDDASSLLELMVLQAHPRRWRVLAQHAKHQPPASEGTALLLEPWRRLDDSRMVLDHLAGYLDSPHLSELREALG